MATLAETGSAVFLEGMRRIGLRGDRVPNLNDVNARLLASTGWSAVGVTGFIPAHQFFRCLAQRRFPTTLGVRPRQQLDYLPEPDIFHDVFGHVPLHADPVFADFLQRFGALAARAASEEETVAMARLFWFTVEFGLDPRERSGQGLRQRAHLVPRRCGERTRSPVRPPPVRSRRGDAPAVRDRSLSGRAVRDRFVR